MDYYYSGSVGGYFGLAWQDFLGEVSSGEMYLQGAIPELLFVYDYSGLNTVAPSATVPAGSLAYAAVLDVSNYVAGGYTNVYHIINQYDAGFAANLPARFGEPGGNACGPTSLGMSLYANHVASVNARSVYDNTTSGGLAAGTSPNGFSGYRATLWLTHLTDWKPQGFSASAPLPLGTLVSFRFATAPSPTDPAITTTWNDIDRLLKMKLPVVIRSDLGVKTKPGSGHMVLVLGIGHSDDLAALYLANGFPTVSGDYYIMADPAGCYYAGYNGVHYSYCKDLMYQDAGMNYGGWFAMYPKELLRLRCSQGSGVYTQVGLVIGSPFFGVTGKNNGTNGSITYTAHSPVVYTITDPLGRQAGYLTNGTILQNIPYSYYLPAFEEEEELGTNYIDALGPKGFEVDGDMDGVYNVQVTGTNSGSYELDWVPIDGTGALSDTSTNIGTTTAGQVEDYVFVVKMGGTPALQTMAVTNGGVAIFWPTNSPGFVLQAAGDISNPNNWTNVTGPFPQVNGVYAVTNSPSGTAMFFRLTN
jgi:hypothetical protein